MSIKKSTSGAEYTLSYPLLGGVDLEREGRVGRERLAYAENMYRDYDGEGGGIIESLPGFREIARLGERIHSLFVQRGRDGVRYVVAHAGDKLYRLSPDGGEAPTLIGSANDGPSRAFCFGYELFVLDGVNMIRISEDGVAAAVGSDGAPAYVPTTYYNGEAYEQRNFLTDKCIEKTSITSAEEYGFGSPTIYYRIIDADARLCATIGTAKHISGNIYVPSYTKIGTERYKVVEIGGETFASCVGITSVTVGEGITKIGNLAFCDCNAVTKVYLPESLASIGAEAFLRNTALTEIYLGSSLTSIGEDAFEGCTKLKKVYYTGDSRSFKEIDNYQQLSTAELLKYNGLSSALLRIPLYGKMSKVTKVSVDGVAYSFDPIYNGKYYSEVLVTVYDRATVIGREMEITGTLTSEGGYDGLMPKEDSGIGAITGNRICETFDGRAFLAGNPNTPCTVYWCAPDKTGRVNPLYFGIYNHFSDGHGASSVAELLSVSGRLAVFKDEDDGQGSVFYHTAAPTESNLVPRVYPVSYIHTGISATGRAISFYDDPVFLSGNGLFGIDKPTQSGERTITPRSRSVNRKLLTECLPRANMARWCGYLVISAEDRMYLADSRAVYQNQLGERAYEWYLATGIGSHSGGRRVYRYSSASEDYRIHTDVDARCRATVYSEALANGATGYYTVEGEIKYAAYPTEELLGGDFYPATAICSVDERLLIFGTEEGAVMIFNNDKRGVAPDFITDPAEAEEYEINHKREIHPSFYSFAGYAPRYAVRMRLDDCDIPHLTKSTVKNSLSFKCRLRGRGALRLEVGTDASGFEEACRVPSGVLDFCDLDFSSLSLSPKDTVSVSSAEKEKGWIEKQLSIYSDEFACPIGIYSAAFRFTVKGRIKNN